MEVKPLYQKINGLLLPSIFIPELVESADKYIPEEEDIIVSSYPECGAEWLSHIVLLILRMGKPCTTGDEYFSNIPLLEMVGAEGLKYLPKPRCIKTHLPFYYSRYSSRAKYIYIVRHPAECVISSFQHTKLFPYFSFSNGTFDNYFDLFVKGEAGYNGYFDHFHTWYAARLKKNVLLLTYESMETDLKKNVLRIAAFLDEKYHKFLMKSGEKVLNEILFSSCPKILRYTIYEYWRDIFIDNPPRESCHCMLPVTKMYAKLKQKAESDGICWKEERIWEDENGAELSKKHLSELDLYINYNIYEEEYLRLRYFKKQSNELT